MAIKLFNMFWLASGFRQNNSANTNNLNACLIPIEMKYTCFGSVSRCFRFTLLYKLLHNDYITSLGIWQQS